MEEYIDFDRWAVAKCISCLSRMKQHQVNEQLINGS